MKIDFPSSIWLRNALDIKKFREKIAKESGSLCELSGEPLSRSCLDHDHITGQTRGVISQHFNTFEGRVLKYWNKYCAKNTKLTLPQFLRKLADYYEHDWSDRPLHYRVIDDQRKKFRYIRKENIVKMLKSDFDIDINDNRIKKEELVETYCTALKEKLEKEKGENAIR